MSIFSPHINFTNYLLVITSLILICSAYSVIFSRNTVHSVLFLILTFMNASILLFILNNEYLAIITIIIYVGAIAVLFLFVVMMLNVKIIELTESKWRLLPISAIVGFIFFLEIYFFFKTENISYFKNQQTFYFFSENIHWDQLLNQLSSIQVIGQLIYTDYVLHFLIASFVLLVAIIGAIVLTLTYKTNIKRQKIFKQISHNYSTSLIFKQFQFKN